MANKVLIAAKKSATLTCNKAWCTKFPSKKILILIEVFIVDRDLLVGHVSLVYDDIFSALRFCR